MALLGILAAAPGGTVSRDRVIGLLWPEADTESARGLLNTAVYDLRRAIGQISIQSVGDDLSLNRDTVRCDVADFESAFASGDAERAVALYHGPFLDGFFVSDAPEFDRWLEDARHRLQRQYRQALERLAAAAPSANEAADFRARLAMEVPDDAAAVSQAMKALADAGDRATALHLADRYLEITRDIGPDEAVVALTKQIRATFASHNGPGAMPGLVRAVPSRRRPALVLIAAAALVIVVLGVRAAGVTIGGSTLPPNVLAAAVHVAPFAPGDSGSARLSSEVTGLLRAGLDGIGNLRVVADSGAGLRIAGSVHEAPGLVRISAALHERENARPLVVASAEGPADELFAVVDQVALQLLAGRPVPPRNRFGRGAAATTTSLRALRFFLAGEQHYRAGRFLSAVEQYREAIQHDSLFALAWYRFSQSVLAADLPDAEAAAADARVADLSDALPEHERLLMRAYAAFRTGAHYTAARLYRSLVTLYPDDVEAWHQLGETLFHYNPRSGRTILESREPFERVLSLDPFHWSARWHLAHVLIEGGDAAAFARHTQLLLTGGAEDAQALEVQSLRSIAAGDSGAERAILRRLASSDELRLFQIAWRAAAYLGDFAAAERVAGVMARGTALAPMLAGLTQAELDLARGRWRSGLNRLASAQPADHRFVLEAQLTAILHPNAPNAAQSLAALVSSVERLTPSHDAAGIRALVQGYAASLRGDSGAAVALALAVDTLGGPGAGNGIRAHLALTQGRFADAANFTLQDEVAWFGWSVTSPVRAGTLERWFHAEALRGMGRDSAALGWYGSFGEHALPDVVFLAPAHLRRGEILELLDRDDDARREYLAFLALWREADPVLQPLVENVRRRVEQLRSR